MAEKHTAKRSLVAAWVALLILAGACGGQSVSASEAIPTQVPPTKAVVATPQGPPESPTETLESVDPASSWQQQGSGQRLEIPSCFDFDQGVVSGPPDPACDINFLAGRQPGSVDLYPVSGARIEAAGALAATAQADCTDSPSLSNKPVTLDMTSGPGVVCYESGEGKRGLLDIVDSDLQAAYTVTFDWWTFDPTNEPETSGKSSSPLAYANDSFGFQLTFPASWTGYSVKELDGSGVGSVCFTFGGDMPICVLQIDVYTHAQWDQLQKLNDGYRLGENDYYVFGAGPFTDECVQMDEFQCDRYHELPAILDTFEAE